MAKDTIKVDEQLTALVMRPRAVQRTYEQIAAQPAQTAPRDLGEALAVDAAPAKEEP